MQCCTCPRASAAAGEGIEEERYRRWSSDQKLRWSAVRIKESAQLCPKESHCRLKLRISRRLHYTVGRPAPLLEPMSFLSDRHSTPSILGARFQGILQTLEVYAKCTVDIIVGTTHDAIKLCLERVRTLGVCFLYTNSSILKLYSTSILGS